MVTSGYGVDTGGFGWLLVIMNNPKIIGPKIELESLKVLFSEKGGKRRKRRIW